MSKKINNALVGCDPELFLYSEDKGKFIPVCGLVGGTKDKPIPFVDGQKGYSLQEDNVMLEYTIPPAKTLEEFMQAINFTKNYIKDTILAPKGLVPRYVASAEFEYDDLDNDQAQTFGCSPDYNAWTLEQNVVGKGNPLMRTSGGHIHVGYDNPDCQYSVDLVKVMDLFLGVPSIILDKDTKRREVYGKAGAYRFKPYGVEYRVLSTFWTENDQLITWAFESVQKAIDWVNAGGDVTNPEQIVECINTANKELAMEIIEDYNMVLPEIVEEVI